MYYLRTKAAANAIQFTVDKQKLAMATEEASKTDQDDGLQVDTIDNGKFQHLKVHVIID